MRFTIIVWYNSKTYVYEIYEDCSFMNFTFMLLNNKTKSINAKLNQSNDWFFKNEQSSDCIKFHNEETDERIDVTNRLFR